MKNRLFIVACAVNALVVINATHIHAEILAEGKTKIIRSYEEDPSLVLIESKDDITGGNGARHDVMSGKAALATLTNANVFNLLISAGIPVAFKKQIDETRFLADNCSMILYEVVIRREAHGSYIRRNTHVPRRQRFPKLIVELYLKTTGQVWQNRSIPCDDPFALLVDNRLELYEPSMPVDQQKPFLILDDYPLCDNPALFDQIDTIARHTFLVLEKAWQLAGGCLVDMKIEFGLNQNNELVVADVIDNDSWRVLDDHGLYIDKQIYRDGADLDAVTQKYRAVAELTSNFSTPQQSIILWRGSERDSFEPFMQAFKPFADFCDIHCVTKSAHKEPVASYLTAHKLIQEHPCSVLVAYVGLSNAAGPMLGANMSVPVITVPATYKDNYQDVFSSLNVPSNVPVMTIIQPANAILAAVNILAQYNPALYGILALQKEQLMQNVVVL